MKKTKIKKLKADLHIHTYHSFDSNLKPETIIKIANRKSLDVIGVVDHNSIKGGKEVEKLANELFKKLIVFTGEEIKTQQGEIIAFEMRKAIPKGLSLIKTIELIKRQRGFILLPHPFDLFRSGIRSYAYRIMKYIDAVEGFNSRSTLDAFNKKAIQFAKQNNLPVLACSDAHFKEEIGNGITLIESESNKEAILKAIKNKKTEIIGKSSGTLPHLKTIVQKLRTRNI